MEQQNFDLIEVKGFCMWPFLRDGQKILVKKVAQKDFHNGDLILYRTDAGLHCHRLLRKEKKDNGWVFYCRPDAALSNGEPVKEMMIEGKVLGAISVNKIVSLETPLARFKAIVILLMLSPIIARLDQIYKKIKGL